MQVSCGVGWGGDLEEPKRRVVESFVDVMSGSTSPGFRSFVENKMTKRYGYYLDSGPG